MSLTVWWAYKHGMNDSCPDKCCVPVLRLDEVREVVEAYLAEDVVSVWANGPGFNEGYRQAIKDILAQLKGVGDE